MRLIDADAFENYVYDEWIKNEISNGDWITFREWLNLQETVVEFDGDINKVMVKGIEYFPQKTGKWMRRAWSIECSECGYDMPFAVRNYCPNCGCRMIEQQECEGKE